MSRNHAIFYHGPFEMNFQSQQPGQSEYTKRDGNTKAPYRGPGGVTGLRFGQMQKRDGSFIITRIQSTTADVCLKNPVRGQGIGPNGAWLTDVGAKGYLEAAIKANSVRTVDLEPLRSLLT